MLDDKQAFGSSFIRPLPLLTWKWSYSVFGYQAWGHYLVHLAIHAVNSGLVYLLSKQLVEDKGIAILVAALFLISPVHGASLGWLSARFDLLCATFFIASLLAMVKLQKSGNFFYFIVSVR